MKRFRLPLLLAAAALLIGGAAWTRFDDSASSSTDAGLSRVTTTSTGSPPTSAPKKRGKKRSKPTTASGPTTTVVANPEAYATALFQDWTVRDRDAANAIAAPDAVAYLFSRFWHATDGWAFESCQAASGTTTCSWVRPTRHLVMQVRDATDSLPVLVVSALMSR